jgi:methyl-accepting chemotaxis protein
VKISTRLTITFMIAALVPLFLAGIWGLYTQQRTSALAVGRAEEILAAKGEETILHTAQSVAQQIELYLATHPQVDLADTTQLEANVELAKIAVQKVGETGYTAVFDDKAITHFHPDPQRVGQDMSTLADKLPKFWAILSKSLDGSPAQGYYDWEDADGRIRPKYMSIIPVGDTSLRVAATTYIDEFSQPALQVGAELDRMQASARVQWLAALVIVAVLAIVGASLMGRWLSRPIGQMVDVAERIADGNLCVEPPSDSMGELGLLAAALSQMATHLCSLIRQVQTMSLGLSSAAEEVTRTQRQHTIHSEEQAAVVASASAAAEELASSSAHIGDTIQQVAAAADQTQANARHGMEAMAEADRHLKRIAAGNEAAVVKVRDLGDLARQIGAVMDLIEDIATQTKLIAFNASIEASAAGEAGRRFAIVAGEVRRLAGDVARSTEEIRVNVERIQITTNELIIASERESKEIEGGLAFGGTMAGLLDQMYSSAEQTAVGVQQMLFSTRQQHSATEQLLDDLKPMTLDAQLVAAGSKQTVLVMENLVAMAQDLQLAVDRFQLPTLGEERNETGEEERDETALEANDAGVLP